MRGLLDVSQEVNEKCRTFWTKWAKILISILRVKALREGPRPLRFLYIPPNPGRSEKEGEKKRKVDKKK